MALINCPECGGQVSDRAETCIHCGYPLLGANDEVFQILDLRVNTYNPKKNQRVVFGESDKTDIKEGDLIDFLDSNDNVIGTYHVSSVILNNEHKVGLIFKNINDTRLDSAKAIIKSGNKLNHSIKMSSPSIIKPSERINENEIKCPKCGSIKIQMLPRRWSLLTGFFTNKVDRVCMNCKHKF